MSDDEEEKKPVGLADLFRPAPAAVRHKNKARVVIADPNELTPKERRRISAMVYARKGTRKAYMKEYRQRPEVKEKARLYQLERRADPERKAAINERARLRRILDPEKAEARRVRERERYWTNEEVRRASVERGRKYYSDPERRARFNAQRRERYANDPEYRATQNASRKKRRAA